MARTRLLSRRRALAMVGGVGVAAGLARPNVARAADITLSMWTCYPELVAWYQAVGEAYSKQHPNVKFSFLSSSAREGEQKITVAVPTGTGPDIYDVTANIGINFIESGMLAPNPPEIDAYFKSGAWTKVVADYFSVKGKTYGLPLFDGRDALYYNKTMFKEAGIAAPPDNFPELLAAAQKLVKVDASGKMTRSGISLRLSGQGSGIAEKWNFLVETAGGALVVQTPSGKWHNGFDNDAGRSALNFFVEAVQKYKIDDPKILHDADAFVSGTTAMLFREPWVIGEIQQKAPTLDYGVVPVPRWTAAGPHKMLLQPYPIYVNTNKKGGNQEAAWDFLKFLTTPENSLKCTEMTGWVTARQGVDWQPLLSKTPQFGAFVTPPKDLVFYLDPIMSAFDELETKVASLLPPAYVNPALLGNPAKIAEAVHQMAEQADRVLKDADLYGTS